MNDTPDPTRKPSERLRVPQPLLRRRIPSGRGAMEQPNVTGDGEAALTLRFWAMVGLTGVATGLCGDALMWILFGVQHFAFSYRTGELVTAVARASDARRVISLLVSGIVGGVGWYLIRRFMKGHKTDIDDLIWSGDGDLAVRRSVLTSVLSEVVIGLGASLGREAAPKLMGGVSGRICAKWLHLSTAQQQLLLACGAGAGLAAVYNIPLAGAFFTAEILMGSLALPTILPALACSWIATMTAWLYLPNQATYPGIPDFHATLSLMIWSALVGVIIGLGAAVYVRLIGWVSHHQVSGSRLLIAMPVAFLALGFVGIVYPQLFGNGKDMAHQVFLGEGSLSLLIVLAVLKPLMTALCLGSGGSGGLLTPTLSAGAVLGGALGRLWSLLWVGTSVGAYAMIGAAAMLGAAMQAPLTALVLVLELTHSGFDIMVPMVAAVGIATTITRHIDGYSIYSARLTAPVKPAALESLGST